MRKGLHLPAFLLLLLLSAVPVMPRRWVRAAIEELRQAELEDRRRAAGFDGYACGLPALPMPLARAFVRLSHDSATEEFYRRCQSPGWRALAANVAAPFLRLFYSITDSNAVLHRGSMFVLSTEQARQLLARADAVAAAKDVGTVPAMAPGTAPTPPTAEPTAGSSASSGTSGEKPSRSEPGAAPIAALPSCSTNASSSSAAGAGADKVCSATRSWQHINLLDVGAGDGGVTSYLAPLFGRVCCTETSRPMVRRLRERGFDAVWSENGIELPMQLADAAAAAADAAATAATSTGKSSGAKPSSDADNSTDTDTDTATDADTETDTDAGDEDSAGHANGRAENDGSVRVGMRHSAAHRVAHTRRCDKRRCRGFGVVSLLNVLDRCDHPLTLLRRIHAVLARGAGNSDKGACHARGDARLLVAVVLPFRAHVEDGGNGRQRAPAEQLPSSVVGATTWEGGVSALAADVFEPLGFRVLALSRVPYLSEGDSVRSVYSLDDAIFVLGLGTRAAASGAACTGPSDEVSAYATPSLDIEVSTGAKH